MRSWSQLTESTSLECNGRGSLRNDFRFRPIVTRNLAAYRWGRRRVVSSPEVFGGEPVFRGTRIPVPHVASLFRKGVPDPDIAEDFPTLSSRDFAYARLVACFGERRRRPRKETHSGSRLRRWSQRIPSDSSLDVEVHPGMIVLRESKNSSTPAASTKLLEITVRRAVAYFPLVASFAGRSFFV
jgi:uncharacterized protein (DUF433 family)